MDHYSYPHGLMFHHFTDDGLHGPGQGAITGNELDALLDYYSNLYNVLPAGQWLSRFRDQKLGAKDVCLTFDDNLRCQYDIARPVLESRGLTGFWFVYTSPLEGTAERLEVYRYFRFNYFERVDDFYARFFRQIRDSEEHQSVEEGLRDFDPKSYLTASDFYTDEDRKFRFVRDEILGPGRYFALMDQLLDAYNVETRALRDILWMGKEHLQQLAADGHQVGLHSHSHPTRIDQLSREEQEAEYSRNHSIISELTGHKPVSMSHPVSRYNADTLEVLHNLDIELGFLAFMTGPSESTLEMPRIDHTHVHKAAQLAKVS